MKNVIVVVSVSVLEFKGYVKDNMPKDLIVEDKMRVVHVKGPTYLLCDSINSMRGYTFEGNCKLRFIGNATEMLGTIACDNIKRDFFSRTVEKEEK